jgi:molybdopterin-guanine dinucleotide biosynthesis protein A
MGKDKALLDWSGVSLLDHALQRFNDAGIAETVVSGDRPGYRCVADVHPGEGPLAGLLGVAQAHPDRRLLVVPVDMPRLPARWLSRLAGAIPSAAVLHFAGAPLPFRFDATTDLVGKITGWLDDPDGPRSLHHLLRHANAIGIRAPEGTERALDNANTPEDLVRISR